MTLQTLWTVTDKVLGATPKAFAVYPKWTLVFQVMKAIPIFFSAVLESRLNDLGLGASWGRNLQNFLFTAVN